MSIHVNIPMSLSERSIARRIDYQLEKQGRRLRSPKPGTPEAKRFGYPGYYIQERDGSQAAVDSLSALAREVLGGGR